VHTPHLLQQHLTQRNFSHRASWLLALVLLLLLLP
jgi:hypothetical protein